MAISGATVQRPAVSGFTLILAATLISGVTSYVVTWLVPNQVGFASYSVFAIFWSFIYLVVGALFGIQQEITRGTREVDRDAVPRVNRARNFGLVASAVVFALVLITAPLWAKVVFPDQGWSLVWPLAVGIASFVMVAVLCGSLYGISQWWPLAMLMVVDAIMRFVAITVVLLFTQDVVALAWAVAIPFPATLVVLWPFIRRSVVGRTQLDVGYARLTRNVAQTIAAATSTGVMVSGFPLVLGLSARAEPADTVGLYILAITLTRAPLIIIAMSLQSYLIVAFRDRPAAVRAPVIFGVLAGAAAILALAGWLAGPPVFAFLFPGEAVPEGVLLAVLVASSALVGALCVTGAAMLARGNHLVYGLGWVGAAVVTVVAVFLPLDFESRMLLSLLAGPVAGLAVHGVFLGARRGAGAT